MNQNNEKKTAITGMKKKMLTFRELIQGNPKKKTQKRCKADTEIIIMRMEIKYQNLKLRNNNVTIVLHSVNKEENYQSKRMTLQKILDIFLKWNILFSFGMVTVMLVLGISL